MRINGLHIEAFIQNPFCDRKGTIITFGSGDRVTVTDDFEDNFTIWQALARTVEAAIQVSQ